MVDSQNSIVIDNGSFMMRCGFSDHDLPTSAFPNCTHRPFHVVYVGMGQKASYIGQEAINKRGILRMYPHIIQNGQIIEMDAMEKIWEHIFNNELEVDPKEYNVLLTEPTINDQSMQWKTIQIMMELFEVKGTFMANQSVLTLLSTGRYNGVALDSGYSSTRICPIYEGHALKHAHKSLDIGGREIVGNMMRLLEYPLNEHFSSYLCGLTCEKRKITRDLVEKYSYISTDFDNELKRNGDDINIEYECYDKHRLPDGKILSVGKARFECTEILFNPSMIHGKKLEIGYNNYEVVGQYGIHELLIESIECCKNDKNIEDNLDLNTIVYGGGNSLLNGFDERLKKELGEYGGIYDVVSAQKEDMNMYAVWIGGAIYSTLSTFEDCLITTEDYEEWGPNIACYKGF